MNKKTIIIALLALVALTCSDGAGASTLPIGRNDRRFNCQCKDATCQ